MRMFRFLLLVLLALIAIAVAETSPKWTIGLIFLIVALSVNWARKGKLPKVKDNSSKFYDEE